MASRRRSMSRNIPARRSSAAFPACASCSATGRSARTRSTRATAAKKKKKKIDETYYEPQPTQTAKPKVVKPPPPKTGTVTTDPALPQKTAAATSAKAPGSGPLTCEKATQVVAGFGFSSVEASSCSGKVYAFNAKRGGKSFAIKLDPASGELTEVKKLP